MTEDVKSFTRSSSRLHAAADVQDRPGTFKGPSCRHWDENKKEVECLCGEPHHVGIVSLCLSQMVLIPMFSFVTMLLFTMFSSAIWSDPNQYCFPSLLVCAELGHVYSCILSFLILGMGSLMEESWPHPLSSTSPFSVSLTACSSRGEHASGCRPSRLRAAQHQNPITQPLSR